MKSTVIYSNKKDIIQDLISELDDGVVYADYNGLHFTSVFQPIYDRHQQLYAFESLVRIHDENANSVDPSLFFSQIERDATENIVHTPVVWKNSPRQFSTIKIQPCEAIYQCVAFSL